MSPRAPLPAPPDAIVAVVEKRGRLLAAEPLFPPPRDGSAAPRQREGSRRLTLPASSSPARAGELVLVQPPSAGRGGKGRGGSGRGGRSRQGDRQARVVRVLGRPDVARDVIEGLMLDRGLRRAFEPAVEHEARALRGCDPAAAHRRDLRGLATFTIDPVTARDFDDAISAERLGDGGVRVWVHIADVSAYVREGSLIDREARRRGTSVYVPGAVEPMLPEALSNDACSLVPGAERLAVTVELELHGAKVGRTAFYRSLICSDERLDYEHVDRVFAGSEPAREPWGEPLQAAREAAAALEQARVGRGSALSIDSVEPEFTFDGDGHVSAIEGRSQTESHRLIEHLMIAANEAVARLLAERKIPCLYRVHERPQPERVERLIEQLATLEVPTPALTEHMSPSQAAELLGELSRTVEQYAKTMVLRARTRARAAPSKKASLTPPSAGSSTKRSPSRRAGSSSAQALAAAAATSSWSGGRLALTSLVLRSLQQAYYSPKNVGHAGLGSDCYCHFTSPIRRYPDLVCHRALLSAIGAGESAPRAGEMQELGVWTSERERAAMVIERDADDVARCFALERVLYEQGWEQTFEGELTGLISAGAFIAFGVGVGAVTGTESGLGKGAEPGLSKGADGGLATGVGVSGEERAGMAPYEGMLPVRRVRGEAGERDWWELNEQGTILRGERSGQTLRLGDQIEVRVARVDTARGRVDLEPVS
ncbi:MAG TPA: RNB domain-containing ribonuclease [Solirubrobacteraceae bacterium]|nr:RNB domain-containing ribonuclease [Solirubrobacteraceae bacterium]